MKRKAFFQMVVFSVLVGFGVVACSPSSGGNSNSQQLEKIAIKTSDNKTSATITKGQTLQLNASVEGVTWESSKTDVATIDANGLATSVGAGSTTITAKKDGYRDGTFNLKVELEKIVVTASGSTELLIGETVTLTANKEGVTWESSNAEIASVNAQGVVTANKLGDATISAKKEGFADGTQAIKVKRPDPTAILSMDDADHYSPTGEWAGYNTSYDTPVYDKEQASGGKCVAHFANGCKETLTFTSTAAVKAEITLVVLARSSYSDLAACFSAKFNNADVTTLASVAYTGSADYPSLEVSLGEFTLKNSENVLEFNFLGDSPYFDDVKVYAESATTITVVKPAEKDPVTVDQEKITVAQGKTSQITSSLTGLAYRSTNENVATVTDTGLVTGVAPGNTTIAISKDGFKTIRLPVEVTEAEGAFVVSIEGITGEGITTRTSQNLEAPNNYIIDAFPANAVGTLSFTAESAGTYVLHMVARASGGYSSSTTNDLATCMELKVNNTKLDLTGTVSGSFKDYTLGEVTINAGPGTIEIKCLTEVPTINVFKFIPKA